MKGLIELDKEDLNRLVIDELRRKLGDIKLDHTCVKIETRSVQNYKSEWECADFRAVYTGPL
jgi:hypothetical protein